MEQNYQQATTGHNKTVCYLNVIELFLFSVVSLPLVLIIQRISNYCYIHFVIIVLIWCIPYVYKCHGVFQRN